MSRPTPRRPASSRGTTQRPRRVAGQATPRAEFPESVEETGSAPVEPVAEPVKQTTSVKLTQPAKPTRPAAASSDAGSRGSLLARPKTTRMLIITLVVVAVALALQFAILLVDALRDEPSTTASDASTVATSAERPVLAEESAVMEGVDAAAKAALEIVSVDHQKYDEEVDAAAALMTDQFAAQYRQTAADIEDDFVANQTKVQANVVAQGVVRANLTRLEALVFLNQVVSRVRDGEPETVVTPFKVLVTMVHTDQGWLVDGLDTDAPQDKSN